MEKSNTRSELKAFCEDSSIYGLKYFVHSRRPWERLFWISFLILGIALSVVIVRKSLIDWKNDPLYTVIDTVSYPVQKNPFPAVTVCPPGRDRWAFIEKVLNYVKFQCYTGYLYNEKDCKESLKARKEFRFLFEEIHRKALDASLSKLNSINETSLEQIVLKYIGLNEATLESHLWPWKTTRTTGRPPNTTVKPWPWYPYLVEPSEIVFRKLLHHATSNGSSCAPILSVEEQLVDFIINLMGTFENNPLQYLIDLGKSIEDPQCDQTMPNNISLEILEGCIHNSTCNEWIKYGIAYIELYHIYGGYKIWDLGSMIAYFSPLLEDKSFSLNPQLSQNEIVLNQHMTELFQKLTSSNTNLSAYDIVALLAFDENGMKPKLFSPDLSGKFKLPSVWDETNAFFTSEGFQKGCYLGQYDIDWFYYMKNQSHLNIPCIDESQMSTKNAPCCKLRKEFDEKMYEIIRMMKYVQYPPHEVDQSEPEPYNLTIRPDFIKSMNLNYPLYNNTPYLYKGSKKEIANPLIPFCSFNSIWYTTPYQTRMNGELGNSTQHCSAFKPSLTDKGICYSWNNDKFSSLFTKSEYIEKISEIFEHRTKNRPIVYPEANGPNYGFKFIIDTHTVSHKHKQYTNQMRDIDVVIHGKGDIPYFKLNGFKVTAGTETDIIVSSNDLYSTDVVKEIDLKKRKCRFNDEPLKTPGRKNFMEVYSQTGCTFQCYLEIAAETCGCTPWYHPRVPGTPSTMCDHEGNRCFYETMSKNNEVSLKCSHCDYDCNRTQHTTSFVMRKIDPVKLCTEDYQISDYPMREINAYNDITPYVHNHNPKLFYLNWKAHVDGKKTCSEPKCPELINKTENCIWKVQNGFAIVNVYLSTPTIPRMKQDVKHKLHDKLSLLGGILGLSCGINILSIFEVMFCISRLILLGTMSLLSGRRPSTLKDMKRDEHPTNSKNITSNDIFEY